MTVKKFFLEGGKGEEAAQKPTEKGGKGKPFSPPKPSEEKKQSVEELLSSEKFLSLDTFFVPLDIAQEAVRLAREGYCFIAQAGEHGQAEYKRGFEAGKKEGFESKFEVKMLYKKGFEAGKKELAEKFLARDEKVDDEWDKIDIDINGLRADAWCWVVDLAKNGFKEKSSGSGEDIHTSNMSSSPPKLDKKKKGDEK